VDGVLLDSGAGEQHGFLRVKSGSNVQDFKNVKEADPNRCTEGEALSVS
jgi:hypothetical protein